MGVVINFILNCYRWDTNKMCVGLPWCLRSSMVFASTTTVGYLYAQNLRSRGRPPSTICARIDGPVNALQLCRWKFSQRNFVADFRWKKSTFIEKGPFCVVRTLWGGLAATYDVHLTLIGKRVVDFLLVIIKAYSLGVRAEALRANIVGKSPF